MMLLEVHFDPSFSSLEVLDIPDVTPTLVTGLPPRCIVSSCIPNCGTARGSADLELHKGMLT